MSPLSDADCAEIRGVLSGKATGYTYDNVVRWLKRAPGWTAPKKPKGTHRTWVHSSGKRLPLVDKGKGEMLPVYVKAAAEAILESGECKKEKEGRDDDTRRTD